MRFTKMQGTGNDFIVLNNMELKLSPERFPALARRVCRDRVSLGGNALMVADAPERGGDLRMRFYNADGSESEMCGNGARCLARYAYEAGLAGAFIRMETLAGEVPAWRLDKRTYKIRLNSPTVTELDKMVRLGENEYHCAYVELGDPGIPHAIFYTPDLGAEAGREPRPLAAALRAHPDFPKGANVSFYDLESGGAVRLKTFERGVEDFTLACGTGAGSAALALVRRGLAASPVRLNMPGGTLQVEVVRTDSETQLYLIGDTNIVAEGALLDEDLRF